MASPFLKSGSDRTMGLDQGRTGFLNAVWKQADSPTIQSWFSARNQSPNELVKQ